MSIAHKNFLLLSVDGLSLRDAHQLAKLAPNFSKLIAKQSLSELDAGSLPNSQAVWSKIFTGADSFSNGCFGYSRINGSLNKLTIFSEKDLLMPPNLMATDSAAPEKTQSTHCIFVNTPVLDPKGDERLWLGDGSLPINKTAHPERLAKQSELSDYRPRAFPSLVAAYNTGPKACLPFIESETSRAEIVSKLMGDEQWRLLVYRCTLFDHLSHLIGMEFLDQSDLMIRQSLCNFIRVWDQLFEKVSEGTEIIVFSAFSHEPCTGSLNINEVLNKCNLLRLQPAKLGEENDLQLRVSASAALSANPISIQLSSMDGRLDLTQTIAASPISGCIYINKDTMNGGIVGRANYMKARAEVGRSVRENLSTRYGLRALLEENPLQEAAFDSANPEFIFHVRGIELHNMISENTVRTNQPRTTHSPQGFFTSTISGSRTSQFCPTEISHLLRSANWPTN